MAETETEWTDSEGLTLVNELGQEFVCEACPCSGLYVHLFKDLLSNDLTVRAHNVSDGSVAWDYADVNMVGIVSASSIIMTGKGILVFAPDGGEQLFLIDEEGALINSGSFTPAASAIKFTSGQVAANGDSGYIFGEAGYVQPLFAEFDMDTFAVIQDAFASFSSVWRSGAQFDRQMTLADSTNGYPYLYSTLHSWPARWDSADLSIDPGFADVFLPIIDGGNTFSGFSIMDSGAGQFWAHGGTVQSQRGVWFESIATNFPFGSGATRRSPCWLSGSEDAAIPNSAWIAAGSRIERWSNPNTLIDTWEASNIPGWDAANDEIHSLCVDRRGNMYFWYEDDDLTRLERFKLVRLNNDFTTIDWQVIDAEVSDTLIINLGRQIIATKGNGRSSPSEEAW